MLSGWFVFVNPCGSFVVVIPTDSSHAQDVGAGSLNEDNRTKSVQSEKKLYRLALDFRVRISFNSEPTF